MPSRQFTAGDELRTGLGALSSMTHGVMMAWVRRDSVESGVHNSIMTLHTSGGLARAQLFFVGPFLALWNHQPGTQALRISQSNIGVSVIGDWYLCIAVKPSGTTVPRFYVYRETTGSWSQGNGDNGYANWSSPGVGGYIEFDWQNDGEDLLGRIAYRGAKANSVSGFPTRDAIIGLGLHLDAANWLNAGLNMIQPFNQSSIVTAVIDITGNGADELTDTGTSVVLDQPANFDFDPDQDLSPDTLRPVDFPSPSVVNTVQFLNPDVLAPISFPGVTIVADQSIAPSTLSPAQFPAPTLYRLAGGWTGTNCIVTQTTEQVFEGSGAGKVIRLNSGVYRLKPDPMIPVFSGNPYTASYEVYVDQSVNDFFIIQFNWLDSEGETVSVDSSDAVFPVEDQWNSLSFNSVAPGGAVNVDVSLVAGTVYDDLPYFYVDNGIISVTPGIAVFDPTIPKWAENGIAKVYVDVSEYKPSYSGI